MFNPNEFSEWIGYVPIDPSQEIKYLLNYCPIISFGQFGYEPTEQEKYTYFLQVMGMAPATQKEQLDLEEIKQLIQLIVARKQP